MRFPAGKLDFISALNLQSQHAQRFCFTCRVFFLKKYGFEYNQKLKSRL